MYLICAQSDHFNQNGQKERQGREEGEDREEVQEPQVQLRQWRGQIKNGLKDRKYFGRGSHGERLQHLPQCSGPALLQVKKSLQMRH